MFLIMLYHAASGELVVLDEDEVAGRALNFTDEGIGYLDGDPIIEVRTKFKKTVCTAMHDAACATTTTTNKTNNLSLCCDRCD